jgi:polysaccharide biosynthesis protein PslG
VGEPATDERPEARRRASGRGAAVALLSLLVVATAVGLAFRDDAAVPPGGPGSGSATAERRAPLEGSERFGVTPDNLPYEDPETRDRILDEVAELGAGWIRFDVAWLLIQPDGPDSFDWGVYDELVGASRERGLQILGTLAYTPEWARPDDCTDASQCAPDDLEDFVRFARAAAERYRDDVDHWEVWNEPNWTFWRPEPDPARYAELLRATYPALKEANPEAIVIGGATAAVTDSEPYVDEVDFLEQVYEHGGRGSFDAWSHHPYTFPRAPDTEHPHGGWHPMHAPERSIRTVMEANGDGAKQLWATEYGWPSSGDDAASEEAQAEHLETALRLWRSYPWAGALFWYSLRDREAYGASDEPIDFHGLVREDFARKPAWDVFERVVGQE